MRRVVRWASRYHAVYGGISMEQVSRWSPVTSTTAAIGQRRLECFADEAISSVTSAAVGFLPPGFFYWVLLGLSLRYRSRPHRVKLITRSPTSNMSRPIEIPRVSFCLIATSRTVFSWTLPSLPPLWSPCEGCNAADRSPSY